MTAGDKIKITQDILDKLKALENTNTKEVQEIITLMDELNLRLHASLRREKIFEQRVNAILETLLRYTMMDFSEKAEVGNSGDDLDAISLGLNTLAEELEDKIKAEIAHVEQLKQQNEDLEKANLELASFAYVSSHDLQEPLRKINTYISRIQDEDIHLLPEHVKFYFARIQNASSRMQMLIRDILEYSRLRTDEEVTEQSDLSLLSTEVREEFREALNEAGGDMEIGKLKKVRILAFQFKRLLNNLVSNSIKFRDKSRPLKIRLTGEDVPASEVPDPPEPRAESYFHLTYCDNGIGFEEEYSYKIFEVFQRLHSQSEYEGTGVGLAICKKIIENHNGVITASSEQGKGAQFDIYLPL